MLSPHRATEKLTSAEPFAEQVTFAGWRVNSAPWMPSLSRMLRFSTVTVSLDAAARAAKTTGTARLEKRILKAGCLIGGVLV